jgi:hypothetical protein
MRVYGHWMQRAYPEGRAMGLKGAWLGVDELATPATQDLVAACKADNDFRFVLSIYLTERRLLEGALFAEQMANALTALKQLGQAHWGDSLAMIRQCAMVQWDDEWWSALYGGHLSTGNRAPHWPTLSGMPAARQWELRHLAADLLSARSTQLRRLWKAQTGMMCPPIGMSECFATTPPEFDGQEWWGVDAYWLPGGYFNTAQEVRALYARIWSESKLALMPVVPLFEDPGTVLPPVPDLAVLYWPIIQHQRTWAVGVFCVNHPAVYNPAHGAGKGIMQLPPVYTGAATILCNEVGRL